MFVLACAACDTPHRTKESPKVLGSEAVPAVVHLSESNEVLLDMAREGLRDSMLVHLSSKINLSPLSNEQLEVLKDRVRRRQWEDIKRSGREGTSPALNGSYLYAAVRLGFVREIYWILPSKLVEYIDAERRVQSLLAGEAYGFPRDEVAAMRFENGCVSGALSGALVHVCSVETFPRIEGVAVLDVDAGFFPRYAEDRGMTVMEGTKSCFDQLYRRRLLVTAAYVRSTVGEGTQSPLFAHVTGNIRDILNDPDVVRRAPPERWSLNDAAASLLSMGKTAEAASFLKDALRKHPEDSSLAMLSGIASALSGHTEKGLRVLLPLCEKDRESCYALGYVAEALRAKGLTREAKRFATK